MGARVVVVVPVYNEGPVLHRTLERLCAAGFEVVAVDDGSQDDSWKILRAAPIHAARHGVNLGQGAALQTGVDLALGLGADVIVHFDADAQHRVEDVGELVAPILAGEADVVLGSRFLRREDARDIPLARRLLLRGGVLVNGLLTGMWLTDAHNGLRAMSRSAAGKIRLRENRFAHASEILLQIRRRRLRWVERPVRVRYSGYSLAKGQSPWNSIRIVIDVVLRRMFR